MKIIGIHVILRTEWLEKDYEDWFRWWNLEEWQYYDEPDVPFKPISRKEFMKLFDEKYARIRPGINRRWQIDNVEGRHIGWANSYTAKEEIPRTFVGIDLPEENSWGKGYGSEAICLLVDYLFKNTDSNEIELATWSGNQRMIACARKCGFVERARLPHRAPLSIRGEPLERLEFSIFRADWLPLKNVRIE